MDILQVFNPLLEELPLGKDRIIFFYIQTCYFAAGLSELSYPVLFFLAATENWKPKRCQIFAGFSRMALTRTLLLNAINKTHARYLSHLRYQIIGFHINVEKIPFDVTGTV